MQVSSDDLSGIPERSRLFHLEPMNIGKPNVESLASYTQRLIEAHSIDFDYFLQYEIYPNLGRQKKQFDYFSPKSVINTGWMIEGSTHHYRLPEIGKLYLKRHKQATEKFIQVLEKLTLKTHLECLTVLPLSKIAPTSGLLRRQLAWCPDCLLKWKQENKTIYYPLLWSIKNVVVCFKHKKVLRQICPKCEQSQQLAPHHQKLGYCSICGEWLAREFRSTCIPHRTEELKIEKEFEIHLWFSKSIDELLQSTSKLCKIAPKNSISKSISKNTENLTILTARIKSFKKTQKGNSLDLDKILEICYLSENSLSEMLLDK